MHKLTDEQVSDIAEGLSDGGPVVVPPDTDIDDLAIRIQPYYQGYGKLILERDDFESEIVLLLSIE